MHDESDLDDESIEVTSLDVLMRKNRQEVGNWAGMDDRTPRSFDFASGILCLEQGWRCGQAQDDFQLDIRHDQQETVCKEMTQSDRHSRYPLNNSLTLHVNKLHLQSNDFCFVQ